MKHVIIDSYLSRLRWQYRRTGYDVYISFNLNTCCVHFERKSIENCPFNSYYLHSCTDLGNDLVLNQWRYTHWVLLSSFVLKSSTVLLMDLHLVFLHSPINIEYSSFLDF